MDTKTFGADKAILDIPNLTELQTSSYKDFLQADA